MGNAVKLPTPKIFPANPHLIRPDMVEEAKSFGLYEEGLHAGLWFVVMLPSWLAMIQPLSPSAKLVYALICSYYAKNGKAYPAQTTLAAKSGLGLSTVKTAIAELKSFGLLAVAPKEGERRNGKRRTNRYAPKWGTLCHLATLVHRKLVPAEVLRFHEVALAKKRLEDAGRSAGEMCEKIADYIVHVWLKDRRRTYPFDWKKVDKTMSQILATRKQNS